MDKLSLWTDTGEYDSTCVGRPYNPRLTLKKCMRCLAVLYVKVWSLAKDVYGPEYDPQAWLPRYIKDAVAPLYESELAEDWPDLKANPQLCAAILGLQLYGLYEEVGNYDPWPAPLKVCLLTRYYDIPGVGGQRATCGSIFHDRRA